MRAALRRARLEAERRAVLKAVPPGVNPELKRVSRELRSLREQRQNVETGSGLLHDPELSRAARDLILARQEAQQAERFSEDRTASWRMRRRWRHEATTWRRVESAARATYEHLAEPEISRLDERIDQLSDHHAELRSRATERARWLAEHPASAGASGTSTTS